LFTYKSVPVIFEPPCTYGPYAIPQLQHTLNPNSELPTVNN